MKRELIIVGLIIIFMALPFFAEAQCAMCKAVLESESNPDSNKVSGGINNGIIFLMGVPYLLIGLSILYFFKSGKFKNSEVETN